MSNNKILVGTSALVAIIFAGAFSASQAYRGDYSQKGPNYSDERHTEMEKAFENNDYNAWKELMDQNQRQGRVMSVINEENFSKFAEAHRLAEEGKYSEADQIRADLGLRTRDGERVGAGSGQGQGKGSGQGAKMGGNGEDRGQNRNGNFVDANGDGTCDRLK